MYKISNFENNNVPKETNQIHFIPLLKEKWDAIHNHSNVFRYKINNLQERIVKEKYLLQLNPNRKSERRTPEHIDNILQPFNKDKFNFTKASPDEILFKIYDDIESDVHALLVNVSPISQYHSLLCPSINRCLPQILTEESLLLVLKLMFLAHDRDLRIGFNGLCAMASVNHLHYHLFFEKNDLLIESAKCTHLHKQTYILKDYLIPGFCYEVTEDATKVKEIYTLIQYLLQKSIAHNILITRGYCMLGDQNEVLRVVVWPRKTSAGVKQLSAFNVAVLELSGWFPVYNAADFENLESDTLETELKNWKLDYFEELCEDIKTIM